VFPMPEIRVENFATAMASRAKPGGRFEIRMPGWEARRFARASDVEGDREILLSAAVPAVMGRIVVPPDSDRLIVDLIVDAGDSPPGPGYFAPVLPKRPGPFTLYDVPEGKWLLRVWVLLTSGDRAHAVRLFAKSGATVDLGEIVLLAPCTVR